MTDYETKLAQYEGKLATSNLFLGVAAALIWTLFYNRYGHKTPLAKAPGTETQKGLAVALFYSLFGYLIELDADESKRKLLESHAN